jgi:serine protease AprX
VAPGYEITAAEANTRSSYVTYSGTSMAAPYVAGVAALIIEANPELTPQQVKNILTKTAQEWGSENKDIDYGAGRLQGYQAVMMAVNTRGSESPSPNHISKMGTLQNRSKDVWQYRINDVTYPVAITMIQENERTDFDLYIYDQNGNLIDYAYSTARQETVSFTPSQTGDYFIEVYSYRGRGNYVLDISGG